MDTATKAYDEIVDLFAKGTPPARILAFRPSGQAKQRVRYLLERNQAGDITEEEASELDRFGQLEHLVQLVKARAHMYVEDEG